MQTSLAPSEPHRLILGCLLFVSGSAIFYMFPPFLAQFAARFSLDVGQLGTLASVESVGIGIASLTAPWWTARIGNRTAALLGILVCVLGDVAAANSSNYHQLLLIRLGVGLLGEGVLLSVSYGVLGSLRNVDKGYAMALTCAVAFGAGVIGAASFLERLSATFGTLSPLIAVTALTVACLGWLPRPSGAMAAAVNPGRSTLAPVLLALIAQAIWFGAPGAFWTLAEQVATDRGIAAGPTELALSVGEFASLAGSLLAAAMGERGGRLRLIIVSTAGIVAAAAAYEFSTTPVELALVLSAFYILWNFGTVYQMALVSSLDSTGRLAVLMPAAQVFGLSVGPLVAGRWMLANGDVAMTWTTAAFAGIAIALYASPLLRGAARSVPAITAG